MASVKKTAGKSAGGTKKSGSKTSSRTTVDHEEIRRWAEERQGEPACVRGTGGHGDTGMLRIEFPGGADEKLQKIDWEDWFEKFEERGLAFLYQEKTARGQTSRFNKLVNRETAEKGGAKSRTARG